MSRLLITLLMLLFMVGCTAKVPKEALQLPPETLENRQLQTRYYETGNERAVLVAANAVLQDIGFNLDETAPELGVIVGSKMRDATDGGQLVLLAFLGALGNNPNAVNMADATQKVKVSLVVRPLASDQDKKNLSPALAEQLRDEVYTVLYEGLKKEFPHPASEKIARAMAKDTAETLTGDLDSLLTAQDRPGRTAVRITFQQVVFNKLGQINSQRQINDSKIYSEFFEKLSKSIFLEANQI